MICLGGSVVGAINQFLLHREGLEEIQFYTFPEDLRV